MARTRSLARLYLQLSTVYMLIAPLALHSMHAHNMQTQKGATSWDKHGLAVRVPHGMHILDLYFDMHNLICRDKAVHHCQPFPCCYEHCTWHACCRHIAISACFAVQNLTDFLPSASIMHCMLTLPYMSVFSCTVLHCMQGQRGALPSASIMLRQPMQRFTQMQASDIDIYRNEIRKTNSEIVSFMSFSICSVDALVTFPLLEHVLIE